MSTQMPPPARRSSWLKPILIIITVVVLIFGIGVVSLVGLGLYGWNSLHKASSVQPAPTRRFSADEEAIIEMVLEREMGAASDSTAAASPDPELEILTEVLADHYQRSLADYANGGDGNVQQQDTLQQALALLARTMQDKSAVSREEAALSPELEVLLEALSAHQQRRQKQRADAEAAATAGH